MPTSCEVLCSKLCIYISITANILPYEKKLLENKSILKINLSILITVKDFENGSFLVYLQTSLTLISSHFSFHGL